MDAGKCSSPIQTLAGSIVVFYIALFITCSPKQRYLCLTWQYILLPGMMPTTWQAINRDLLNRCQNEQMLISVDQNTVKYRALISALVRVLIAVVKHHGQNQLGEEMVDFGLYFHITIHHPGKSGQAHQ